MEASSDRGAVPSQLAGDLKHMFERRTQAQFTVKGELLTALGTLLELAPDTFTSSRGKFDAQWLLDQTSGLIRSDTPATLRDGALAGLNSALCVTVLPYAVPVRLVLEGTSVMSKLHKCREHASGRTCHAMSFERDTPEAMSAYKRQNFCLRCQLGPQQAEGHDAELAELFAYARDTVYNVAGLKRYGPLNAALRILQVRCRALLVCQAKVAH